MRMRRGSRRAVAAAALAVTVGLLATGCAGAGASFGGGSGTTLRVAVVANPQMQDMEKLIGNFERQHPDIHVDFVTLPENEARDKITQSVATQSGVFDVVMLSNYETPIWARNGWLVDLTGRANRTPGYDPDDLIPSIRTSLSYKDHLYAVPFYGESSFLMYRKDVFAAHGLHMPAHPTWQQVASFARKLNDPEHGMAGICLRGLPGWGEVLAPLDTVINTFGGRWFDQHWHATLNSPAVRKAVSFYVDLVRSVGEPGAASSGFTECATKYGQGNAAMWYDATSAAGLLEDPDSSAVVGKTGYVAAPVEKTESSGWLYSWALAMPATTEHRDAAWQFMAWATSKRYLKLVGHKLGWAQVPPGSRLSTYQLPQYRKAAKAFAQPTLRSMKAADPQHPTVGPVPYTGVQFVDIPEFVDLGTRVSQQITAAIAGQKSVADALAQSQKYAEAVAQSYRGQ